MPEDLKQGTTMKQKARGTLNSGFPHIVTRDALRGHTVSKNGTISFSSS